MLNPYSINSLYRNPKYNKMGHFLTLSDFLNLPKGQTSLLGVVITIEVRSAYACYFSFQFIPLAVGYVNMQYLW